ncbi:FixH family protein [Streptomyces sp. DSM 42041]|uniref:FixH family protein n=1 Tax=Streptomyces hazeniae TaxID=3075538 RepID=A0ABU2NPH3_9ACTN|nr:FixH family protein [Streptomyces sp. DSM 42041]MDT0378884.1 FixH family protein [Streptomyces sp. DSM 42041]
MPSTTAHRGRRRTATHGTLGVLAVLAALCAYLLGAAPPAAAHAVLTGSTPAAGAVVDAQPEDVVLTFSEAVQLSDDSVRVLAPDGSRADTGETRERSSASGGDARYATPLRDGLADGTYTVAWQVVSADSHPISGAFTFSVGAPSKTTVALPDQEAGGGAVGVLYDLARSIAYAGLLLLVGGAGFVLACWPQGTRVRAVQRLVTGGWVAVTAATLAMLLLRTPYTGSGRLVDAFDLGGLADVVGTRTGTALVSRLLLLAAAALFTAVLFGTYARTAADGDPGNDGEGDPARRRDLVIGLSLGGGVVSTGLAVTWAASEHASSGIQTAVAMPVDVVHLLAAAAWLGGLATLAVALRSGTGAVPATAARRFSRIAPAGVLVLALTGTYQSWRQVGSWSALTGTDYGRLLLLKLALIVLLLVAAYGSRRWVTRLTAPDRTTAPAAGSHRAQPDPSVSSAARTGANSAVHPAPAGTSGAARATAASSPTGTGAPGADPARAAQLARQRAAVEAARRRRARDADPDRRGLRRTVLVETGLAVAVLAATTLLTGTEPARTAQAADTGAGPSATAPAGPRELTVPFDTGGPRGKGKAKVTLDPGGTGRNTLDLRLTDASGKPLDVPEVRVSFTLPAQEIGPLRVAPREDRPGRWRTTGLRLPVPGAWEMALTVRTSDIDQITETRTVRIG